MNEIVKINPYGFREYDARWIYQKDINQKGISNLGKGLGTQIKNHLKQVDGVMIGRSIYHSPYFLADIEKDIFSNENVSTREEVVKELIDYVKFEIKKGTKLHHIMRHTLGLFHGQSGSSYWKRYLSENMCVRDADVQKVNHIMDKVKSNNFEKRVGSAA